MKTFLTVTLFVFFAVPSFSQTFKSKINKEDLFILDEAIETEEGKALFNSSKDGFQVSKDISRIANVGKTSLRKKNSMPVYPVNDIPDNAIEQSLQIVQPQH